MKRVIGGQLKLLSGKQVEDIYSSAEQILEDVGVCMREQNALKILGDSGADVDYRKQTVRLPRSLVEEAVRKTCGGFTWYARNSENSLRMGDGNVNYAPGGTFVSIFDLETGEKRPSTFKDVENFGRIIDGLENIHEGTAMVTPSDLPRQDFTVFYHAYLASLRNTSKCVRGLGVQTGGRMMAEGYVRMAAILAGGVEELRRKPYLMSAINPVSPLEYSKEALETILIYSRYNVPMFFSPETQAGATGPVTLAGVLAQSLAEALAGIVFTEMINPGNPVMIGTVASIMDMKVGQIVLGSIEAGLLGACTAQIAHHLGIPCRASAGASDSKLPDAQAGYESALNLLLVSLVGANLIQYSVGTLDFTKTGSYEMLIIGDEILGEVSRALKGVDVSKETLAVDMISRVGPGGSFLGEKHTREYFRREHRLPILTDRRTYDAWKAAGGRDISVEAREKARRILAEHHPEPLERSVEQEIQKIILDVMRSVP